MNVETLFAVPPEFDMTPEESRDFLRNGIVGPFLFRTSKLFNNEPYDPSIDSIPAEPRSSSVLVDTRVESLV